jgi:hypothetical protein
MYRSQLISTLFPSWSRTQYISFKDAVTVILLRVSFMGRRHEFIITKASSKTWFLLERSLMCALVTRNQVNIPVFSEREGVFSVRDHVNIRQSQVVSFLPETMWVSDIVRRPCVYITSKLVCLSKSEVRWLFWKRPCDLLAEYCKVTILTEIMWFRTESSDCPEREYVNIAQSQCYQTGTLWISVRVSRLFWQRPCYIETESGDYSDRDHGILRQGQSAILTETMLFWDRVRWLFWQRPCYFETESVDYSDRDHVILWQSQVTILTETMLFWDRVSRLF